MSEDLEIRGTSCGDARRRNARGHRVRGHLEADIRSLGHWLLLFSPTPTLFFLEPADKPLIIYSNFSSNQTTNDSCGIQAQSRSQ